MRVAASYRVAIVGCGRMAGTIDDEMPIDWPFKPYTHAGAYLAVEATTVVAAANRGREALDGFCRRWGVSSSYTDYREMIVTEKPDIVSVCTPQESHSEVSIFAAEHGVRAILCEKPMAPSMAEADRIVAAVRRNRVCFNLGVNRRFRLDCGIARDFIDSGELGEVRSFTLSAGGTLKNSHSHYVDLMSFLLQDASPMSISARLRDDRGKEVAFNETANLWTGDPTLHWLAVEFDGGKTGYIQDPGGVVPREWRVVGTKGCLLFHEDGSPPNWYTSDGEREFPHYPRQHSPTIRMVEDLIRCLESGGTCLANEEVSSRVNELCNAAAESHLRGAARVSLPLADRNTYISAQSHSRTTPRASSGRS